ncbi:MAG: hypothetical protein ABJB66_13255 [Gemmatimonadaceae bacterium]
MPARDDYFMRMIQQVAATLRRLREKLEGGAPGDEVMRDANAAIVELLGTQRSMLEMLDANSAAALIGDADKLDLWIALLKFQSEVAEPVKAARLLARANALSVAAPKKL